MDVITVGLGILCLLFTIAFFYFRNKAGRLSLDKRIPGPPTLPILGNLLSLDIKKPHLTMTDWTKTFGAVYRVRMGPGRDVIVVGTAESIREALIEKGRDFAGRPRPYRAGYISNRYRNIGFGELDVDPWWKPLRNTAKRQFRVTGVDGIRRLEELTASICLSFSGEVAFAGDCGRKPIDLRPFLYTATLNIMSALLVGSRYSKTDEEFQLFAKMERLGVTLISSSGGSGAELDAFPWLRYFGHPTCRRLEEFASLRDQLFTKMKERAQLNASKLTSSGYGPVLWTLIEAIGASAAGDSDDSTNFNEENVKGAFSDVVMGGTASTTNLVYALVNILLHYPEVHARIKAELAPYREQTSTCGLCDGEPKTASFEYDVGEIDCNIEDDVKVRQLIHRYPKLSDRSKLPYLQATLLELLRYVCIAPFTVPHKALVDTTLGGYQIPSGTEVLPNLWALHHDPTIWHNPWEFDPTRFLYREGSEAPLQVIRSDDPLRRHFLPFGAGPRRCTGEAFALSRLFLVASHVLTDFDFLPPEATDSPTGQKLSELVTCDPRTYDLGIAVYPMDYQVRMIPTSAFYRNRNG